jgi:hypothetical protein
MTFVELALQNCFLGNRPISCSTSISNKSEGVEEQVGEEAIELNHDASGDGEPDGSENRGGGEEFFHG